jgi:hypothetical protein
VQNWDYAAGFEMEKEEIEDGTLWSYMTEKALPANYYQYKYLVTFDDNSQKIVSDPCDGGILIPTIKRH